MAYDDCLRTCSCSLYPLSMSSPWPNSLFALLAQVDVFIPRIHYFLFLSSLQLSYCLFFIFRSLCVWFVRLVAYEDTFNFLLHKNFGSNQIEFKLSRVRRWFAVVCFYSCISAVVFVFFSVLLYVLLFCKRTPKASLFLFAYVRVSLVCWYCYPLCLATIGHWGRTTTTTNDDVDGTTMWARNTNLAIGPLNGSSISMSHALTDARQFW